MANPKAAAKQGLRKMKQLADLGFHQGVLPPLERPSIRLLRNARFLRRRRRRDRARRTRGARVAGRREFGFGDVDRERGDGEPVRGYRRRPRAFHAGQSQQQAASRDRTRANAPHARAPFSPTQTRFAIHHALPGTPAFGDEGAANHTRFCADTASTWRRILRVWPQRISVSGPEPKRFPGTPNPRGEPRGRASHGLRDDGHGVRAANPDVIDAGVFHNDVIAVGNRNTLFCHQRRSRTDEVYDELRAKLAGLEARSTRSKCRKRSERGRRRHVVSVQQPVADAPGRQAGAGRAAGMPRERARGRLPRSLCVAREVHRRRPGVRSARKHEERRRPGVPAPACRPRTTRSARR